mgnify:CR=1 FL=1
MLKKHVHEDFYMIDLIKKGIVYIHGKMPEQIKDYLEYKFNQNKQLKYIIANHVILEGMNLPIDSLFILTVNSLSKEQLVNLIGRVNRLNEIFTKDILAVCEQIVNAFLALFTKDSFVFPLFFMADRRSPFAFPPFFDGLTHFDVLFYVSCLRDMI